MGGIICKSSIETYTLPYVKELASRNFLYDAGTQSWCSVTTSRGGMGRKVGGRFKREGTYVYLWLIHVDVWQKPSQYCQVILQLKIKYN